MKLVVTIDGRAEPVDITGSVGRYRLTIGDEVKEVDARVVRPGLYSLLIDGASSVADVVALPDGRALVAVDDRSYTVEVEEYARHMIRTRGAVGAARSARLTAPMPGRVTHVAVAPGDAVKAGDTLLVIEAMKMENEFKATAAGRVAEVRVRPGEAVNPGDVLIVIE